MSRSKSQISEQKRQQEIVELKDFITFRLAQLNAKLTRQATRILQKHSDFTLVQWRVVSIIYTLEKCTFTKVAELSGMDSGLVSRNLKQLTANGFVLSVIDSKDQRKSTLSLSQKGKDQYLRMLPIMRERQRKLTEGYDSAELSKLLEMIDLLSERSANTDFDAVDENLK